MKLSSKHCLVSRIADGIAQRLQEVGVELELDDGRIVRSMDRNAIGRVRLKDNALLFRLATGQSRRFAEAYVSGNLEIDGDLLAMLHRANAIELSRGSSGRLYSGPLNFRRWADRLRTFLTPLTDIATARRNVSHHYDTGNEFFASWLDPTMTYTCAYFPDGRTTLEEAQIAKMDLVCRKVALKPGDEVIEAGSGWGGLALYMAERYGARVRAFNVSGEQIEFARHECERRGLRRLVEFLDADYREIDGSCDVFISVGMLEALGTRQHQPFGQVIRNSLRPGGRVLVHTIGRSEPYPTEPWIAREIFPGGRCPALSEIMNVFEPNGLAVSHVENLRAHYVETLSCWRHNFLERVNDIEKRYSAEFTRRWWLYLTAAEAAFATGWLQLFQVVARRIEDTARLSPDAFARLPGQSPDLSAAGSSRIFPSTTPCPRDR